MLTNSPRLLKGGLVLMDPDSGRHLRIIALQYNPEKLTRSLQAQYVESQQGDRSEALRLTGPPVETIKLEAEIDAADHLERPELATSKPTLEYGINPQLAALETILYPTLDQLRRNDSDHKAGVLEVAPMLAPLTIFVWGRSRIAPVRLVEYSVEEQFFDPDLNPIRAKVSLGMRVLNVNDLGFSHRGANIYMVYQQQKETLAKLGSGGTLNALGAGGGLV